MQQSNVVPLRTPKKVYAEGQVNDFLRDVVPGDHARLTFKDACQINDAYHLGDLEGRKFLKFSGESLKSFKAIYLCENGCEHVSRSFFFEIIGLPNKTIHEKFETLSDRVEGLELF